ncbi:hypothetical protein Sango_2736700 [Sesamum angolense]|uniref:Pentatricopeptide repeat-containing protein n=1 Tax=Sesamum angolense TaxID=2727404 RepID=A0AAE1W0G3_9LAMI|nr:hypothetical protein Sango_2736700 [Sesamum angolense]
MSSVGCLKLYLPILIDKGDGMHQRDAHMLEEREVSVEAKGCLGWVATDLRRWIQWTKQLGWRKVGRANVVDLNFKPSGRFGRNRELPLLTSHLEPPRPATGGRCMTVNSLLSAMCREDNHTVKALEFFERIKSNIPSDADSFAILLEGWEKEGNVTKAKHTFGEMVIRVGWSPQYMFAYDAFLNTLVRGAQGDEAIKFLQVMKGKNCLPGLRFFSNALDIFAKQNDSAHAIMLWDIMNKKVREVGKFFIEMVKNEWPPTPENFTAAIKMLFDGDDPEMAIEIWKYMAKNNISPRDDGANAVLLGFCNLGRLTDLRRFIEKMIDERIIISESTMTKVKNAFYKEGRSARDIYDHISRKWKSSYL